MKTPGNKGRWVTPIVKIRIAIKDKSVKEIEDDIRFQFPGIHQLTVEKMEKYISIRWKPKKYSVETVINYLKQVAIVFTNP